MIFLVLSFPSHSTRATLPPGKNRPSLSSKVRAFIVAYWWASRHVRRKVGGGGAGGGGRLNMKLMINANNTV